MSTGLSITDPIVPGPAQLVATDVPEADYPAHDPLATYALADRVIYEHNVYESAQAANTGHTPLTQADDPWWLWVGATNRWGMFDLESSQPTAVAGGFYYEFNLGYAVDALHLQGIVDGFSLRVRLTDASAGVVFDTGEVAIGWNIQEPNWWELAYGIYIDVRQRNVLGMPTYPQAVLRIDVVGGAACAITALLVGQTRVFGRGVRLGMRSRMRDAIKRDRDRWGGLRLRRANWWDTQSIVVSIPTKQIDAFREFLQDRRANVMYWRSSDLLSTTQILGFFISAETLIPYATESDMSIELEGIARD